MHLSTLRSPQSTPSRATTGEQCQGARALFSRHPQFSHRKYAARLTRWPAARAQPSGAAAPAAAAKAGDGVHAWNARLRPHFRRPADAEGASTAHGNVRANM